MLLAFSVGLFAQTTTPKIDRTQKRQQARIHQGVKSGKLTKGEARQLEKQQQKIQQDKGIAKSNGVVTPHERKYVRHKQKQASKNIYRKKHNNKTS